MINLIPGEVWTALAAFGAFIVAMFAAWFNGRKSAKSEAAKRHAKSLQKAKDVRDETEKLSDDDVRDALSGWLRPGK